MQSQKYNCFLLFGLILASILIAYDNTQTIYSNSNPIDKSNEIVRIKSSATQEIYYLLEWDRYINNLQYGGVAVDSEDNVYYGGSKSWDYFIAKYQDNGSELWSIQNNIIDSDFAEGIAVDSEDSVYISGYCYLGTRVTGTIVTRKYNKTGDFQWDRRLGTRGRAYDITKDNEDNVYVTGYTEEFGASGSDRDTITIKYDSDGNLEWYRRSYVVGHDEGNALIYNPFSSLICVTGKAHGNMLLLMYDKNGNLVFSTEWDNGGTEYGNDITVNPSTGNLFIVGGLGYVCVAYDSVCNNVMNMTGPSQESITINSYGDLFVSKVSGHNLLITMYSSEGNKYWELIETNYYPFSLDMDCNSINNFYLICTEGTLYKFSIDLFAPIINITTPEQNEEYGRIRPDVVPEITEPNLHTIWYNLSNESLITNNYTSSYGNIHQNVWELMGNGNISINIYANDTNGNVGYNSVSVIKNSSLSYYWDLNGTRIYIDDIDPFSNWVEIEKNNPWCYGSGTPIDPYIIENVLVNGSGAGKCIEIKNSVKNFVIKNCTVVDSGSDYHDAGILFNNISNGRIVNCTSINGYYGIRVLYSKNDSYLSNRLKNNNYGIVLIMSNLTMISDNSIINNGIGINLESCVNQQINNNQFKGIPSRNIWIEGSRDFTIYNNTIDSDGTGVIVENSDRIQILKNRITRSDGTGIVFDNTRNSTILKNIISQNDYGIVLDASSSTEGNIIKDNLINGNQERGLWIRNKYCVNNLIYNNSFVANDVHVLDVGINTLWDNGSLGNFWDNYNGKDANDDGIGDDPYYIGTSIDNFPIWWDPPVFSIDSPEENEFFSITPPIFTFIVEEGIIDKIFYYIDTQPDIYILPSNRSINQYIWNTINNGTVYFHFYANDSQGYISVVQTLVLRKDIIPPTIEIISPTPNEEFGTTAPNFEIVFDKLNVNKVWYVLGNDTTKFYVISNFGNVDQSAWNSLPNGEIMIRFYINDMAGNVAFDEIYIQKFVQQEDIPSQSIPGFNILTLLIVLCVTISFLSNKKKVHIATKI